MHAQPALAPHQSPVVSAAGKLSFSSSSFNFIFPVHFILLSNYTFLLLSSSCRLDQNHIVFAPTRCHQLLSPPVLTQRSFTTIQRPLPHPSPARERKSFTMDYTQLPNSTSFSTTQDQEDWSIYYGYMDAADTSLGINPAVFEGTPGAAGYVAGLQDPPTSFKNQAPGPLSPIDTLRHS